MKILLVDNHPVFRIGMGVTLCTIFEGCDIIEVGNYIDLKKTMNAATRPDLVLLDLWLPGFEPMEDFPALRKEFSLSQVVVVSMTVNLTLIKIAMAAGANGFLSKTVSPNEIAGALKAVMNGDIVMLQGPNTPTISENCDDVSRLTKRQFDVLRCIGRGLSNKAIALELNISDFTVRNHASAILRTLDLPNRSAAASLAAMCGLLSVPHSDETIPCFRNTNRNP